MTRARDLAAFVSNADGDIKFDTDTLFIDSSTNRVGLGTNAPSVQLDIESTAPTIRLTDSDASGTPESEVSGAGGDIRIRADRDNEKASSLIGFEVDGTERMRIDNNGKVGIGVTPESNWSTAQKALQVGTTALVDNAANDAFLGANYYYDGSNNKYINSAPAAAIGLVDGSHIFYTAASGSADANISFSEKVRILQGGGLTFNGDTAAANALDDYEEGTFAPTITCGGGTALVDTSEDIATYTKIGRMVNVQGRILVGTISSPSSALIISNLPFTVGNAGEGALPAAVAGNLYDLGSSITGAINAEMHSQGILFRDSGATTGSVTNMADHLKTGTRIGFNATYIIV